jgi:hypothetical protein
MRQFVTVVYWNMRHGLGVGGSELHVLVCNMGGKTGMWFIVKFGK